MEDGKAVSTMARRKAMVQVTQAVYVVTSPTGPRFCFHAGDDTDAMSKLQNWLRYHGMHVRDGFGVEQLNDTHPAYCHNPENIQDGWVR